MIIILQQKQEQIVEKKKKKKIMKIDFIFVKITSIMKSDWKLCC